MKILMFNRWVGYNEGGNETHIKELAVFLNKQGHKIDILTTGNKALKGIKKHLRKVYQVPSPQEYFSYSPKRFFYSVKYLVSSFIILDRLLRKEKRRYDVITVHFSLEALLMRFVRLFYGIPYVLILVGDTDLELIEGKRANNTSQLTHYMGRECVPYGYYPKILTKGVDRKRFNRKVDGASVRKKYVKKRGQFMVITVCRLDPRKNLETYIEAASILEKKHKDVFKFVIVGGGIEEQKLKDLTKKLKLENTVYFTGSISSTSNQLTKHYAAADVYAMPTLYEGFGYVFSEAMAFGLPVIGTDTSAVPEVIEDVGVLIPMRDPERLAKEIYKVYKNKSHRDELSEKSIRKVEQWYWDVLIEKYEKFILEGIEKFSKRADTPVRVWDFFWGMFFDLPKMLFIGIRPLIKPKDSWGSILKQK